MAIATCSSALNDRALRTSIALARYDRCPGASGDGGDTGRIVGEEIPSLAGFVDDVVVVIEHGDGEFVCAQILPDVFDRIELWRIGRQA
jgi:hypothetical protein